MSTTMKAKNIMKQSLVNGRFGISRQIVMIASLIFLLQCKKTKTSDSPATNTTVNYRASEDDFPNPERGFYRYTQTTVNNFTPLDLNQLKTWRNLQQADGGNYSVYSTLVFRYYILDGFTTTVLPAGFLANLENDFNIARQAGI
ncbi:MAG: DUF4874 domain-containing protein, partial [Ferruginibacter sp.]|nr:DUF4874 domain-containing protein [Chitinophagaceae bacterium]